MSNSTTATVETLTAEVRVLMVGSRQVTLSVARQLDYVDLEEIEPFGRVKLGGRDTCVIGRSRETGVLVLANIEHPGRIPLIDETDLDPDLDSKPVVCGASRSLGHYFLLRLDDRDIRLYDGAAVRCGRHSRDIASADEDGCGHWDPNGHKRAIGGAIQAWDARVAECDRASKLPLIVLAGLR